MAAIEVTISGVLYDKLSRTTRPCVLIGEASVTGLEVGGGPMPGGPGGGGGGGAPPHPAHPIWRPDLGFWGGRPPEYVDNSPPQPQPPEGPPNGGQPPPDGADKPPPEEGGWGFVAEWSQWGYFPGPDQAGPKR